MKKGNLYEIIVLRAMYNKELHDAIKAGDSDFLSEYIKNYDNDDKEFYDFTQNIDMSILQRKTAESEKEYEDAIKSGRPIMGM